MKIVLKNLICEYQGIPVCIWDADVNREHYTAKIKPDLSKIGRVLAESKMS